MGLRCLVVMVLVVGIVSGVMVLVVVVHLDNVTRGNHGGARTGDALFLLFGKT